MRGGAGGSNGIDLTTTPITTSEGAPPSPNLHSSTGVGGGGSALWLQQTVSDVEVLYEEAHKGAKESKSLAKFLKQRALIDEEYGKALLRLCKSFPQGSSGSGVGEVFSGILEGTAKQAGSMLTMTSQLTSDVVAPLKQFVKNLKTELKAAYVEAENLDNEKKEVIEALKKTKVTYENWCKDIEADPRRVEDAEEDYKARIEHTNTYLQVQYPEKFQKIAHERQKTETLRIHKTKQSLQRYHELYADLPSQGVADSKDLFDKLASLDAKKESQIFAQLYKSVAQKAEVQEIVFEPYIYEKGGPAKAKSWRATMGILKSNGNSAGPPDKANGKLERKSSRQSNSNPVFGVPLDALMESQKAKFPDLPVPHVIIVLIDLIKYLNGMKTEGIFRVPGMKQDADALKNTFDEGGTVEAKLFPNVHTAASVFKLWFRELPNSIIPEDIYYSCLACATPEEALVCFDSFPQLNKKILLVTFQFFREMLQEENKSKTRMDVENIAIVFTPSFMRCSTVPQTSLLDNVDKERAFITFLVASCDHLITKYSYMLPAKDNGWRRVGPTPGPSPTQTHRPQLASTIPRMGSQNFVGK